MCAVCDNLHSNSASATSGWIFIYRDVEKGAVLYIAMLKRLSVRTGREIPPVTRIESQWMLWAVIGPAKVECR